MSQPKDKQQSQLREVNDVNETGEINSNDIIRILVATDNHLGYMERDRVRRDDSFITMEEIMNIAKEKDVDFILHGGDLFHENKPSRETLHKTIELFRKYCCGDKPVPLVIQSDQRVNFRGNFGTVNYEDPNFNISLPVFAIHGNHDDPTGENGLSAMDLLSVSNLVNYFGKADNIDDIHVKPVLISKGCTKLALYGLGWIRDERLYRTFEQKKVKFYRPIESKDEWFNIFVLHQNRHQHHTKKSSISDAMLRGFFDVVIWGHEHEQQVMPAKSAEGNFDVMQPGSSIVTSLSPEESKQKKIAILEIYKDQYRCIPVDLQTVRPFVMNSISLQDFSELDDEKNNPDEIADFLAMKVNELIEEAKDNLPPGDVLRKHPSLKLPLVRLKVDYSGGYAAINPQRFGQRFIDKVANPSELLVLSRARTRKAKSKSGSSDTDTVQVSKEEILSAIVGGKSTDEDFITAAGAALTDGIKIDDLVAQFLKQNGKLSLMNECNLADSVVDFVEKEEQHAINDFVEAQIKLAQKKLWKDTKKLMEENGTGSIDEQDIIELIEKYAEQERAATEVRSDKRRAGRASKGVEEEEGDEEEDNDARKQKGKKKRIEQDDDEDEEFENAVSSIKDERLDSDEEEAIPKRGRGRGKSTTTTTRGRGRGRGKATTTTTARKRKKVVESDEEEEDNNDGSSEEEYVPKKSTTRSRSAASNKRKRVPSPEPEESEEEPAPKRGRRATSSKASTTKKKPVFKAISIDSD